MEDPIITSLRILTEAQKFKFELGDLERINLKLDSYEKEDFPVAIYIVQSNDLQQNTINETGYRTREVTINLLLLTSDWQDIDYSHEQVEPFIENLRQKADQIVSAVNKDAITDTNNPVEEYSIERIYAKHDYHLFGVNLSFDWTVKNFVKC